MPLSVTKMNKQSTATRSSPVNEPRTPQPPQTNLRGGERRVNSATSEEKYQESNSQEIASLQRRLQELQDQELLLVNQSKSRLDRGLKDRFARKTTIGGTVVVSLGDIAAKLKQKSQEKKEVSPMLLSYRKWQRGGTLTADEQQMVNKYTRRVRGTPSKGLNPSRVAIPVSNYYESLDRQDAQRRDRKKNKHESSNLKKQVNGSVTSGEYCNAKAEPEASVGLKLPSQYEVDTLWTSKRANIVNPTIIMPSAPVLSPSAHFTTKIPGVHETKLRRALMNLRHVVDSDKNLIRECEYFRSWTSPVPFGPALETGPSPLAYLEERETPGGGILGFRERRLIGVLWFNRYQFAYLDFIGWWNRSGFSQSASRLFADHWGVHFHEDYVDVLIPADLVNEMKEWWNHKERDPEAVNFGLSVSRCRVLTSELAITAEQLRVATLYAPAIAYLESWEEQQNVSRVTFNNYLSSGLPVSFTKNKQSLSKRTGKMIAWASCGVLALGVLGGVILGRSIGGLFDGKKGGVIPPAPRLVGIETNPGPALTCLIDLKRLYSAAKDISYKHFIAKLKLNAHCAVRPLVNCASLPHPKNPGVSKKGKLSLSDGNLRYPLNLKTPTECRGSHFQYGFGSRDYKPSAFASNQHNEKQALVARILCDTPEPDAAELEACLQWCKQNYRKLFPYIHKVKSVSWEEYLRRSNSSPSVKRILQKTHERLVAEGMTEDSILTAAELYRFTKRSSFVKVENDLYDSPLGRKHKAPRLIQGAQPEFICLVGPWIMALQDAVKRCWGKDNFLCFTSGVSAEDAAEFITGGSGPWLEDDLGKFDSSIRAPWCEFEVWLCKKFGAPRAVLDLMSANIKTHGTTHHGWKYKCLGTRKSGDPYTSVFNSIINGVSHLYLYCKWTHHSVESARRTIRMLLQGDDNCCRHLEKQEFPWQQGMASLGFDSEAIYRRHYFQVEFCSNRLYLTKQGYCFGPKPGRVLAKLGYVINPPEGVAPQSMMRGIALGLKRSCNFIPPLSATVEKVINMTEGYQAWYKPKQFTAFDESELKVKTS